VVLLKSRLWVSMIGESNDFSLRPNIIQATQLAWLLFWSEYCVSRWAVSKFWQFLDCLFGSLGLAKHATPRTTLTSSSGARTVGPAIGFQANP
jgi:hypothetical protein